MLNLIVVLSCAFAGLFSAADGKPMDVSHTGGCIHQGNTYVNGEEWTHITTEKDAKPATGFKMVCRNGQTDTKGCLEDEMEVPVKTSLPSQAYDGFSMKCGVGGFEYVKTEEGCDGKAVGEVWNEGTFQFECTDNGVFDVVGCVDADGNLKLPNEEYIDATSPYKLQCKPTPQGLTVDVIACIDGGQQEIPVNQTRRSGLFQRRCVDERDQSGNRVSVRLVVQSCCEADNDHCVAVGSKEQSRSTPRMDFVCETTPDGGYAYRYVARSENQDQRLKIAKQLYLGVTPQPVPVSDHFKRPLK